MSQDWVPLASRLLEATEQTGVLLCRRGLGGTGSAESSSVFWLGWVTARDTEDLSPKRSFTQGTIPASGELSARPGTGQALAL